MSRVGLIEAARSTGCRVVGITAPAGYGKSTLLAEWARAEDRRVAWVSLDRFDDDPATLVTSLAAAYCRAGLGSAELIADVAGHGVSALGRAAPRLASEIRAGAVSFVFMLDDLHEVRSPACHDVLGVVVLAIPPGLSWPPPAATSSRTCPGSARPATRWSSGPATWLWMRPVPGRSSRTRRSA